MPPIAKKAVAPIAKKTAPAKKPAFDPQVGDIVVFKAYEQEPEAGAIVFEGDYLRVNEIDLTKKKRKRYHVQPITADEEGNEREPEACFAEEFEAPTAEQQEEIESLLAQAEGEEEEDFAVLGVAADAGDEDAAARLTTIAAEQGLDPEDYPTWEGLGEALNAPPEEEEEAEEEEEQEEAGEEEEAEDLLALGEAADAEDGDAGARLTELATEAGLDPEAYPTWLELAQALSGEEEAEEEAPATPAKKAAKGAKTLPKPKAKKEKAPKANAKKAGTGATKGPKLNLTESVQRVLSEANNDLLTAMHTTETQIGQNFLDLGGLVKLGEIQSVHQMVIDEETGKPQYENTKKGYYDFIRDNLETDERTARHLGRIYHVFIAKLGYEPESLVQLGIGRLREIAGIAGSLAKLDKEAEKAEKGTGVLLDTFLQESATLTVRDVVAKVRAFRSGGNLEDGTTAANSNVVGAKIATLTFRLFEDKANFVKACLESAMSDLPEAERNADNALYAIFAGYATNSGIPEPKAAKAKAAPAKVATKTAAKVATKTAPAKKATAKKA